MKKTWPMPVLFSVHASCVLKLKPSLMHTHTQVWHDTRTTQACERSNGTEEWPEALALLYSPQSTKGNSSFSTHTHFNLPSSYKTKTNQEHKTPRAIHVKLSTIWHLICTPIQNLDRFNSILNGESSCDNEQVSNNVNIPWSRTHKLVNWTTLANCIRNRTIE